MTNLIWFSAWFCVFIWSLICWAAFGLVDMTSALATGSSGIVTSIVPGSESLVRMVIGLADDVGEGLIFVLWLGGIAFALGGAWLITGVLGTIRLSPSAPPTPFPDQATTPWPTSPPPPVSRAEDVLGRLAQRGIRAPSTPEPKRLDHRRPT